MKKFYLRNILIPPKVLGEAVVNGSFTLRRVVMLVHDFNLKNLYSIKAKKFEVTASMKRQKRDRFERAHNKGFTAGINGKSSDACPFNSQEAREHWLGGWREARAEISRGYYT